MQKVGGLARDRVERIIVEDELLRAGFAAFPYLVMKDNELSVGGRLTYAFLLMYAWQEGSCFASQQKLAEDMGISRAQVQRYLYELREAKYIKIQRKDKRFNNTYTILGKRPSKLRRKKKVQVLLD